MEISIEKTIENPYLQRKEVHGTIAFTGATPSHKQLADSLASKMGTKAEAIFVVHVYTEFGSQKATFEAHVYASKEIMDKVVRLGSKAKEKIAKMTEKKEEPKKEEKPAEKKEEAKPAEKKEEKKEEPKKEEKPVEKKEEKKEESKKEAPKEEGK